MTTSRRPLVGALALVLASLILLLMVPYSSAHGGGTPAGYKEDNLTLGPEGRPGDLFHQFGFQ